jgi:glutamate/tyrosine decarboxylase-like PLP-dependent enzyme
MEQRELRTPGVRVLAPTELSIVCWRVEPEGVTDHERLEALQREIVAELERRQLAIVSSATLRDRRTALRTCIINFRIKSEDVELLVQASAELGVELA